MRRRGKPCLYCSNNFYFCKVKNLERLIGLFRDDPRTQRIIDCLTAENEQPKRILLTGMIGAQETCVLSGTYLAQPRHHLFVATDKEEAAYLQNNVSTLLHKKTIHFFPDSFKQPMKFEEIKNSNVLLRTETINKFANSRLKGEIVITYPEALFEKVVSPKVLNDNKIDIKVNEKWEVDEVIELFIDCGFERVDFVYEPGQFSIRGGIVDIFSFGNELPYRVELFDDEVESIRIFSIDTQLSIETFQKIEIVPNTPNFLSQDKASQKIIFDE